MINLLKQNLWNQFGASIDMLENAILSWPEETWDKGGNFFYIAYHTLIFLDYYLKMPAERLSSPLPFTFMEPADIPKNAMDDIIPDKIYSKQELLHYLQISREKCYNIIWSLTEEKIAERWEEQECGGKNFPFLELLLYNMRHVQHHAAQLNMLLRLELNDAPRWVRRAKN